MGANRRLSIAFAVLTSLGAVAQLFVGVATWGAIGKARATDAGFGPSSAFAQELPMMPPPGVPGFIPLDRALARLNLSPEQRASIDNVVNAHRRQRETELQSTMAARLALMQTVFAETFDEAKIREAAATVAASDANTAVTMAALLQEIRALLTPDQQRALQQELNRPPVPRFGPPRGQG